MIHLGECEPCPNGTEKTTADTSLCKKKEDPIPTTSPTTPDHPSTTLAPSGMGGKTTESTPTDTVAIGAGIGVLGSVFVIAIVIAVILYINRKRKQRDNNGMGNKRKNCCSDDSSNSSASVRAPLVDNSTEKSGILQFNNTSSISSSNDNKPTLKVLPTISIDDSEKKGNNDSDDNIDDEIMHDGHFSERTGINVQLVNQEDNMNSMTEELSLIHI